MIILFSGMGQGGKALLFLRKDFCQTSFYKHGIVVIFKRADFPGRTVLCKSGVRSIRSKRGKAAFQPGKAAGGVPFNACQFQSKGDIITDLTEDMAAEQKARTTYDNILRTVRDSDVADPIRFLRAREIVHFQRFGEALRLVQERLDSKNFYAFNPEFDRCRE